mmetsp:Transcript_59309/g.109627  ORF Transcript_59309/g.109627 Transcript_59309/m.109627 type:complete len:648 (-) Transcript_59309:36-1979(-)
MSQTAEEEEDSGTRAQPGSGVPQREHGTENDVDLAPLAVPEELERVQMDQIDSGPVDYVVKCTEGLFAGRFIYINRTPQGELFGSDRGSSDITMYIENANLSPVHAEIKFNDQTYQYFLRDLGSVDGTWIRVRWNRSVEIAPGQVIRIGDTLIDVTEGVAIPSDSEVKHWLKAYQLQHLANQFEDMGIRTLQDARELGNKVSVLFAHVEEEELSILNLAVNELDKMWPPSGYPTYGLQFNLREPPSGVAKEVCSIMWEGGTIALTSSGAVEPEEDEETVDAGGEAARLPKDVQVGAIAVQGWQKWEWLRVGYSFGRYYMHLGEKSSESSQKGWVRLRPDQRHWLQPHDLFKIGTLEFQVMRFNAAVHSDQGFRATMEDEEIMLQDLATSNWRHCSYFAVYDGHGGRECVSFIRRHLHMNFVAALHAKGGLDRSSQVHQDIYECLDYGFKETDRQFLSMVQQGQGYTGSSGCAAVVACIVGGWVWCANVGDSRAIICRGGKAVALSLDHKPDREDEASRIEAAGGFVSYRRVLGRLAVSRAFGDEEYKTANDRANSKPLVICDPEIRVEQLMPQDEFLFMACDGLFDVFNSQEAVDFIYDRLGSMPSNEQDPQSVVRDIVHEAIHERRSRDNVTAVLVTFKRAVNPHR